ncbi:hypothetical protein UFOVP466_52 [uncultured Caudovirales phage]|uniref:Uncharacterized protein n=1 Tax=uncultured Caudovirales phage TaxID=2100421 RepID=A0A6J5MEK9_9CAUD|nr:hypothetical protein UFOVP466_52 [uncultured Caudovirales phage]CAB4180736.1 hypothetical protein UFOVP1045_99 [uncultured Caudovirales phage]CAB4190355.1 hypothetical protein UFOVP1194_53 [uncultured Caudovirales phage]CAB4221812.1 hypothetical protein UFOVP1641_49 [uncultured Caudovirales phage]
MRGWILLVVVASLAFAGVVCEARSVVRERTVVRRPVVVLERPPVTTRVVVRGRR